MDNFANKHEGKNNFCTGKGIDPLYYDSQITGKVMLHFAKMGYAIPPLHDRFIIHHSLEQELHEAMNKAFKDLFGVDWTVDIKHRSNDRSHERDQCEEGHGNPREPNLSELLELQKPYSIYHKYLNQYWAI